MSERLYDVWLNGRGYRLVDGINAISSNIGTPLAAKVVTGDYALSDFDFYSMSAQSNFQGGIGQLNFFDITRHLWGHRIDARGERVTLGPKLHSTQPDSSRETTKTVSLLDIQSHLNSATANEPENQTHEWVSIDQSATKVAVPFATAGATPGGGTFEPGDLSSLVLWLKADTECFQDVGEAAASDADGDVVKLWKDQSGVNNHWSNASGDCTWEDAEINGLPAVVGSGTSNGWLLGDAPVLGSTSRTIFILMQAGSTGLDTVADFGYQSGAYSGEDYNIGEDSNLVIEDGRRYWSEAYSTSSYQIVAFVQDGSNVSDTKKWIDGVESTIASTLARTLDIGDHETSATLFCRNAASKNRFSQTRIVEIIVCDSALSTADHENVQAYLVARAGGMGAGSASGSNVDVQRVWTYLRSKGSLTSASTLNYAVYTDVGGSPGAAIASGTIAIDIDRITYFGSWVDASFVTIPTISGETSYWLVFDASGLAVGESVEVLTVEHGLADAASYQKYVDSAWETESGYTGLILAQYLNQHPDTPAIKFLEWNGFVYALAGRRLYRIIDTETVECVEDATGIHELAENAVDMLLVQRAADVDPSVVIALGPDAPMEVWDGATGWSAMGAAEHGSLLCYHDNLWWRASQSSTDGVFVNGSSDYDDWVLAGTAGPKTKVGDSRYPINQLFSWRGQLYATKIDGLYIITYADTYPAAGVTIQANRILSLETEINADNFRAIALWQEDLYFSLASGVAKYTSGNVFSAITPDSALLEQQRTRGSFVGLMPTLTYLYAIYESSVGDWSQIMTYNGAWNSIATLDRTGDLGGAMFADSGLHGTLPRIWTSSMTALTSFVQPTWSSRRWTFAEDNVDSEVEFFDRSAAGWYDECAGRMYMSWMDAELLNIVKDWIDLDVVVENVDANAYYINVYYRFDDSTTWTLLGKVSQEPVTKLTFPTDTVTTKIQLRFDFVTNESYNSPQLLGFALRYVARPETTEVFGCQIEVADGLELRNNSVESRSGAQLWEDLKTARDAEEAIKFIDISGQEVLVHVSSLSRQVKQRQEVNATKTNDAYIAIVEMMEA